MIYNRLKRKNFDLPKISLGTAQFGMDYGFTKAKSQEEVNAILEFCLAKGINFVDTARDYGDSEVKIGSFIKNNKDKPLMVATKVGHISQETAADADQLKSFITESVETSLKNLNKKQIDLLMLHQADDYIVMNEKFWTIMESLRNEGKFQMFGVSVYEVEETRKMIEHYAEHIDVIQIPYNVFDRRFEDLFSLFEEKNIDVISRSVFLRGMITVDDERLPEDLKGLAPLKNRLKTVADQFNVSVSGLALLYILNKNAVSSTILGVNSIEEIEQNLSVLERLDDTQMLEEELKELSVSDEELIDPRKWSVA